jgi:cytochrome c2
MARLLSPFLAAAVVVSIATAGGVQLQRNHQRTLAFAAAVTGGDSGRGPEMLRRYGCGGCHRIPGVSGAQGRVGPPLDQFAVRAYVAGMLPNEAGNLIRWIVDPRAINPRTAMPATGVTEADARHMAAYLYTLR